MKKHIKRLLIHLSILIFIPVFYFVVSCILALIYDLAFRQIVVSFLYVAFILCGISFIFHIIFFIFHIIKLDKPSFVRGIISAIICVLFSLVIFPYMTFLSFIAAFTYNPEYVVEQDGKKMIVSVTNSYVYYYEYESKFLRGYHIKIEAYKGNVYDPFKNNPNLDLDFFDRYTYYDNDGKIIKSKDSP